MRRNNIVFDLDTQKKIFFTNKNECKIGAAIWSLQRICLISFHLKDRRADMVDRYCRLIFKASATFKLLL